MLNSSVSRRSSFSDDPLPFVMGGVIVLVILACILYPVLRLASAKNVSAVTVCSKERSATDDGGEYRIYTDHGTYVMTDVLFVGGHRTNTADAYGKLKVNTTYDLHTIGWRFGLTSSFPNILTFTNPRTPSPGACS